MSDKASTSKIDSSSSTADEIPLSMEEMLKMFQEFESQATKNEEKMTNLEEDNGISREEMEENMLVLGYFEHEKYIQEYIELKNQEKLMMMEDPEQNKNDADKTLAMSQFRQAVTESTRELLESEAVHPEGGPQADEQNEINTMFLGKLITSLRDAVTASNILVKKLTMKIISACEKLLNYLFSEPGKLVVIAKDTLTWITENGEDLLKIASIIIGLAKQLA